MKLRKLALLFALLLMAILQIAIAQKNVTHDIDADAKKYATIWTKDMNSKLHLTGKQYPKVMAANEKQLKVILKQMDKMRLAKNDFDKTTAREGMKPAAAEKEFVMKGILTPPQFVDYKQNEVSMRESILTRIKKEGY